MEINKCQEQDWFDDHHVKFGRHENRVNDCATCTRQSQNVCVTYIIFEFFYTLF